MSTIMRKPLIETITDSLDKDTLLKLNSDIDSSVGYSKYDLIEGFLPVLADGQQSMTEKVTLVTNGKTLVGSYIKYDTNSDIRSFLLNYGEGVHKVYIYEIDEENRTTYLVGECLGVSELRRVISERLGGGGGVSADVIRKDENGNVIVNNALEITAEGNAVVGKNLEVDGGLQVNEGAIFFQGDIRILEVLTQETDDTTSPEGYIIGYMDYIDEDKTFVDFSGGIYLSGDGLIYDIGASEIYITYIDNHKIIIDDKQMNALMHNRIVSGNLKTIFGDQPLVGEGNIDLYRHSLSISGATPATTLNLDFLSSSNLKCDSVQDLRTLLKISGNKIEFLYGNLYQSPYTQCQLVVSADICQFTVGGTSTAINVTTVQDTVTTI